MAWQPDNPGRHVVDVGQFDRDGIERLFAAADRMRELPRLDPKNLPECVRAHAYIA